MKTEQTSFTRTSTQHQRFPVSPIRLSQFAILGLSVAVLCGRIARYFPDALVMPYCIAMAVVFLVCGVAHFAGEQVAARVGAATIVFSLFVVFVAPL